MGAHLAIRAAAQHCLAAMVYRSGDRCPACWGTHWLVGRTTAECVRCGTSLQLSAHDAAAASASPEEQR